MRISIIQKTQEQTGSSVLGERGVASAINKDHVDERLHISVVSDIFALR